MKMDKKKALRWGLNILTAVLAAVFLYALCRLGYYFYDGWKSRRFAQSMQEAVFATETTAPPAQTQPVPEASEIPVTETAATEETAPPPTENPLFEGIPAAVDFDVLQDISTDAVAWLYCPGTVINYVVARSEDNEYYLHRLLDGSYVFAGTLFMDYRNSPDFSDWNTVIYGHNMKDGSMFASLVNYSYQDYYEEHPVIFLYTPGHRYALELIAGYTVDIYHRVYDFPFTKGDKLLAVQELKEHSTFQSDVTVEAADKIVTLSTCSFYSDDARYVVIGKLVEG